MFIANSTLSRFECARFNVEIIPVEVDPSIHADFFTMGDHVVTARYMFYNGTTIDINATYRIVNTSILSFPALPRSTSPNLIFSRDSAFTYRFGLHGAKVDTSQPLWIQATDDFIKLDPYQSAILAVDFYLDGQPFHLENMPPYCLNNEDWINDTASVIMADDWLAFHPKCVAIDVSSDETMVFAFFASSWP